MRHAGLSVAWGEPWSGQRFLMRGPIVARQEGGSQAQVAGREAFLSYSRMYGKRAAEACTTGGTCRLRLEPVRSSSIPTDGKDVVAKFVVECLTLVRSQIPWQNRPTGVAVAQRACMASARKYQETAASRGTVCKGLGPYQELSRCRQVTMPNESGHRLVTPSLMRLFIADQPGSFRIPFCI